MFAALNCKEMAVTLPVIVLIYEFLKVSLGRPRKLSPALDPVPIAAPSLIAGLLTVFHSRENRTWQRLAGKFRSLSTQIFMA